MIGKVFGYDYVLGALMDTEKSISNAVIAQKEKGNKQFSGTETTHVNILRSILERQSNVTGAQISRFERRHRTVGGNAIRAAVLGGNDGLVSNFSLVMGVAGATSGDSSVLLAGTAGCWRVLYQWCWGNGFLSKVRRNCTRTRCRSKWKNSKPIRRVSEERSH